MSMQRHGSAGLDRRKPGRRSLVEFSHSEATEYEFIKHAWISVD